jgi:glutamate/tyrosine decarboxylase-like PLP-dependent enzyme
MNDDLILTSAFEKIKQYLAGNADKNAKVVDYKEPYELRSEIDFQVGDAPVTESEFLHLLDKYLEFSVRTGSPQFLNQLYQAYNFPAFIGEIFTVLANTSMYTYEVAPVATLIEKEMIALMNDFAGYKNGDGIFLSGGSNSNLVAMFSARNQVFPEGRLKGYDRNLKLTAFVNEQAHYSIETAANVLGIGTSNVIKVKADSNGALIADELETAIQASLGRGEQPFFVVATCATTVLGAFDPIDEMAEICKKYSLWLHADGSFGGSALLSSRHRHLLKGLEKTDSFAWNPHKLMNIPLICSVLLVKKRGTLQFNIIDVNTDYLYHDSDDIEDLGKKSIQCGRRVDAVKLWFAWKYFGKKGYEQRIDNSMEMAAYAEKKVLAHDQLELMAPRQSFTVCFRYLPKYDSNLNDFNLELREALRKSGKSAVNYGFIGEALTIRLVVSNGSLTSEDMDIFFDNLLSEAAILEKQVITKDAV